MKSGRRVIAVAFAFLLACAFALPAFGASAPLDSPLEFHGTTGESVARTLNLSIPAGTAEVDFVKHDLVNERGQVILASSIGLDPPKIDAPAPGVQHVLVTITLPQSQGTYAGPLDVLMGTDTQSVRLEASAEAKPVVTASPAALSIPLHEQFSDVAFFGSPHSGGATATGVIDLRQTAKGAASVESVDVLAFRKSDGTTLPVSVVKVSPMKATIPSLRTQDLTVTVSGKNLDAGTYTGTLVVNVADQDPILVTATINVKDGPLIAFLILLGGLLASLLFSYWSRRGNAYYEDVHRIRLLKRDIDTGSSLWINARNTAKVKLAAADQAISDGADVAAVKAQLDAIDTLFADARKAATDLETDIATKKGTVSAGHVGRVLQAKLLEALDGVATKIDAGSYADRDAAALDLSQVSDQISRWTTAAQQFDALSAADKEARRGNADAANTIVEFEHAVAGTSVPERAMAPVGVAIAAPGAYELGSHFKLSVVHHIVAFVTWGFVLALGWVTLYMKSSTFGADPSDYISLFLWAAVASTFYGKAIGFGDLKQLNATPPAP